MVMISTIQTCNHKILQRTQKISNPDILMKRGYIQRQDGEYIPSNSKIDYIPNSMYALCIEDLYIVDNNVKKSLSPEIYSLHDNSIVWLDVTDSSASEEYISPIKGAEYYIHLKYYLQEYKEYTISSCPQCGGKCWYLDLVKEGQDVAFTSGAYVVAEEFVKSLMNIQASDRLDVSYGTELFGTQVNYLNDKLVDFVHKSVAKAETKCKSVEAADPTYRDDSELLNSAIIESITFDEDNTAVIITITLLTEQGNKIRFNMSV